MIVTVILISYFFIYNGYSSRKLNWELHSDRQAETEPFQSSLKVIVSGEDVDRLNMSGVKKSRSKSNLNLQEQACKIPKLDMNGPEIRSFFFKPEPLDCKAYPENWVYIDGENKVQYIEKRRGILMNVVRINNKFLKKEARTNLDNSGLNVYFLGFDSLSQMSFRRKLPKTVKVLEETLKSVILNGYNIVGDGTPQAFIPILTGFTEEELPLTRKRFPEASFVDDVYPFIWNNFSSSGYVTLYGEDAYRIGTFTYRLKGFRKKPTDHYLRTIFKEYERLFRGNCLGSEPLHKAWFRYSRDFMTVYKDIPRFLLMHQSLLSHDDINLVEVEDEDLANHLASMHENGEFDNTLVILMADHGHRFAKLRETHQGQLEERLPFFSLALPNKFKETEHGRKMYENLLRNKDRLTTPFDIHATLMDILHLPNELTIEQNTNQRSLSIFRPIPENRTCAQAGVEPHWCTCLSWEDALSSPDDRELSGQLAMHVVEVINRQLKDVLHLCAKLALKELIAAKKLVPSEGVLKYKNVKDPDGFVPDLSGNTKTSFAHYQLKLRTKPGDAIYEITLFYDNIAGEVHIDLAAISHVNKYGNNPHCIIDQNYFLATYCVCHDVA
ncbi:hypothetical protein DICVIV_12604 [Dictyocaulus viviparus]|uniref:Uncharacterized protein n=1 Tax=Dictyocaulus viviparus TaxID=29172 RepID=A0A0D8XCP1_DICVI|nr:hypothetical protein DICVIV_12604 [Dictyocaulus viviparus]